MIRRLFNISTKFWVLADQAMVSGSSFVTNILVARALGITDYGKFSVLILVQLFLLGIQQAVSSGILQVMASRYQQKERAAYVGGVFYAQCGLFLLVGLIGAGLFGIFPSLRVTYAGLFAPALTGSILFLAQDFLRKTLITLDQIIRAFIMDTLTNVIQLSVLAGMTIAGSLTLERACWVIGLTFIPSVALGIRWVNPGRFDAARVRHVFHLHKRQGGWMLLSALLQWFAGNLFVVAAGWWLGLAALGALRLAQYIFGLLNVILQSIENYILPKASRVQNDPAEFNRYLLNLLKQSMLLVAPALVLVVIFAKPLLSFSGGTEYARYAYVMYGLAAAYLLIITGIPIRIALRVKMLNRDYFIGYVLATIFSLLCAKWMIRRWDLAGVLAGLFSTQLIVLSYWLIILKVKNIIKWKSSISF